ncbi:UNKNOWN [Stylonychia lemnae]|uniref:Protein kinase domain containing protein n=1 Tax=Stylonychia lemnae TaxID=5949 RepID=A0A078AAB3_STYLE|nr:UNKNOWN [Stylonychia lemnae]|eukprot:CDW78816.1 UNKNOWN [Stylonychia lemnae]
MKKGGNQIPQNSGAVGGVSSLLTNQMQMQQNNSIQNMNEGVGLGHMAKRSFTHQQNSLNMDPKEQTRKSLDVKYNNMSQNKDKYIQKGYFMQQNNAMQQQRASPDFTIGNVNPTLQNKPSHQKFANQNLQVQHKRQLSTKQQAPISKFQNGLNQSQMDNMMMFYPNNLSNKNKLTLENQQLISEQNFQQIPQNKKYDSRHSIQIQSKYSSSGAPSYTTNSQEKMQFAMGQTPTDFNSEGMGSGLIQMQNFKIQGQVKPNKQNAGGPYQKFPQTQNHSPNVTRRQPSINNNIKQKKKIQYLYGAEIGFTNEQKQNIKNKFVNQSIELQNYNKNSSINIGNGSMSTRFQEQNQIYQSIINPQASIIQEASSVQNMRLGTAQQRFLQNQNNQSKTPDITSPNKSIDFTQVRQQPQLVQHNYLLPSQSQTNNNPYQLQSNQIKLQMTKQQQIFNEKQQQFMNQHRKNKSLIQNYSNQQVQNSYQQMNNNFLDQNISMIEQQNQNKNTQKQQRALIEVNNQNQQVAAATRYSQSMRPNGIYTPDITKYMQKIKQQNQSIANNYEDQVQYVQNHQQMMMRRKQGSKTPVEFDSITQNSMILDGGTGSEGGNSKKYASQNVSIQLSQNNSNHGNQLMNQNSMSNQTSLLNQSDTQNKSSSTKISLGSLQKSKDRLQKIQQQQQKLKQQLQGPKNKSVQRYQPDPNSIVTDEDDALNQFNIQDIKIQPIQKSKEYLVASGNQQQVKIKQKTTAPVLPPVNKRLLNITEEALAIGKVPPEDVARLLSKSVIKSEKDLDQFSPRTKEMALISAIVKESFQKAKEAPVTTTDFYRAGKMLGKGAFGKVSLGMHKLSRKLVAIKSINKEYLSEEKQKNKVMHEVGILLRMRHPSVVKLYETFETGRHILLVMELCAGGDLLNYVRKRRKLKEDSAKLIFRQIIEGLGYIHSKNILHRDIKLDNILLDGKGKVKIADFGVSKLVKPGETMREQCGTPAYIAPEIIRDKGYQGFKADIWSAGVVLYAMLYGTVPFKANNMQDLHKLILKAKYNLKDEISEEAKDLLRKMLELDVSQRLTIKQVLSHPWMQDIDENLIMFNEQELEVVKTEFTYNDPSRFNRNEPNLNKDEEPWDCFTELNLDSMNCTLRNASEKSVILAPFNSSMSDDGEFQRTFKKHAPLVDKKLMIRFAARCRDQDRQYEINNNCELDNGVYHKFVYSTEQDGKKSDKNDSSKVDRDDEDEEDDNFYQEGNYKNISGKDDQQQNVGRQADIELLSSKMKESTRNAGKKKDGNDEETSFENSFEQSQSYRSMKRRIQSAKIDKNTNQLKHDIERKKQEVKQVDNNNYAQQTLDGEDNGTFQSNYSFVIEQERVQVMVDFGFPRDYVLSSLTENEANYCSAGYYLLGLDQNY